MKIKINKEQVELLRNAINYVVLSLDGNQVNNSKLSDLDKLHVLGNCYYIQQAFNHVIEDEDAENKDSVADG